MIETHFLRCSCVLEVTASMSYPHFSATHMLVPQTSQQRANVQFLIARSLRLLERL